MVNVNKLKGKLVEREMTVEALAAQLGINRATLYRKLSNGAEKLLVREANAIVSILGLTPEEAMSIFFNQFVA